MTDPQGNPKPDASVSEAKDVQSIWNIEADRWSRCPSPVVPLLMGLVPQQDLGDFLFFLHRLSRNDRTRDLLMRMLRDPKVDVSQVVQFLWDTWKRQQESQKSQAKIAGG